MPPHNIMINVLSPLTLHHHDHQHHGHQEHSRNILWSFLVFAWFIITMQYVIHVLLVSLTLHHQHTKAINKNIQTWCLPAPPTTSTQHPAPTQMIKQSNSHHSHHTGPSVNDDYFCISTWFKHLATFIAITKLPPTTHHSNQLQQRSNSSRSHTTVCQWLLHHQHQQPPPASTTTFNHTISTLLQQTTALPSSTPQFKLSQHLLLLKLPRNSAPAQHLPPLPQNHCHKSSCSFSPFFSMHSMLHHNSSSHLIQHKASSSRSPHHSIILLNHKSTWSTNTHSTAPTPTNIHSNSIKEIMIFCCWLSHDSTTKIMIWLLSNDHYDQKPPHSSTNSNSSIPLQIIWICDAIHHTLTLYHHQPPPKPSTFKHLAIITNVTAVQPPTTPPVQLKIKQSKGTKQQKPAKEFPTRFYCILCAALYSDCMIIGTFQ